MPWYGSGHGGRQTRWGTGHAGEKQAAEDMTQDAFIKVWRSAESYRPGRGSVRTWILSVVRNQGIDQLRARASRRRTQEKAEASAPRSEPSEAFARAWGDVRQGMLRLYADISERSCGAQVLRFRSSTP